MGSSVHAPQVIRWDADALTAAQCAGLACVSCHKRAPLPTERVGELTDGAGVLACPECADAVRLAAGAPGPVPRESAVELMLRAARIADEAAPTLAAAPTLRGALALAARPHVHVRGCCLTCRGLNTAVEEVARHLAATEDMVRQSRPLPEITTHSAALTWIKAWERTLPSAGEVAEVLTNTATALADTSVRAAR